PRGPPARAPATHPTKTWAPRRGTGAIFATSSTRPTNPSTALDPIQLEDGPLPSNRLATAPTSAPIAQARPPPLGVGTAWEDRSFGWSKLRRRCSHDRTNGPTATVE